MDNKRFHDLINSTRAGGCVARLLTEEKWRKLAKKMYRVEFGGRYAPTVYPLTERSRSRDEGDGDGWIEYGFFEGVWDDGEPMTDDEVREYIDESIRVRIYSPYDCTGQAFTMWLDWHRNPSGLISYINHMRLDV